MSKRKSTKPKKLSELLDENAPPHLKDLIVRIDGQCQGQTALDVQIALMMLLGSSIYEATPEAGGDFDQLQQVLKFLVTGMLEFYPKARVERTKALIHARTDGRIH